MAEHEETPPRTRRPSVREYAGRADSLTAYSVQARRTRRALWNALIELLGEHPFARIRVTEICERALVHRVTFYKHFENKHDLLERGSHEAIREMSVRHVAPSEAVSQIRAGEAPVNFLVLFDYVAANRRLMTTLLASPETAAYRLALLDALDELAQHRLASLKSTSAVPRTTAAVWIDLPAGLAGRFSAGAIVSTIEWWLAAGCEPSPTEMSRILGRLLLNGFRA